MWWLSIPIVLGLALDVLSVFTFRKAFKAFDYDDTFTIELLLGSMCGLAGTSMVIAGFILAFQ